LRRQSLPHITHKACKWLLLIAETWLLLLLLRRRWRLLLLNSSLCSREGWSWHGSCLCRPKCGTVPKSKPWLLLLLLLLWCHWCREHDRRLEGWRGCCCCWSCSCLWGKRGMVVKAKPL